MEAFFDKHHAVCTSNSAKKVTSRVKNISTEWVMRGKWFQVWFCTLTRPGN